MLAIPLLRDDRLLGGLVVNRNTAGEFSPEVIELLKTFATQSALAIQNARLFTEIEIKGRQLETASRHKSEFLANMSHELRTPLNAVIGFSEVLSEQMFGTINDKQAEYLKDILESGRHLLSLINDILDLSKIEAGRMELEATEFELPTTIENALILVRERASRHGIDLKHTIDGRLGTIRADERKVKQVLLNLLTNALKFTPEGGRVEVRAAVFDGAAEIAVSDTGVGHRARGSGDGVRGIPAGRLVGEESRGDRAWPRDFAQVCRAPWRPDQPHERTRHRIDVRVHAAADDDTGVSARRQRRGANLSRSAVFSTLPALFFGRSARNM